MRKLIYLAIISFVYSCSTLPTVVENKPTDNQKDTKIEKVEKKEDKKEDKKEEEKKENIVLVRADTIVRVRITALEKSSLNLKIDNDLMINEEAFNSGNFKIEAKGNLVRFNKKDYESLEINGMGNIVHLDKSNYLGNFIITAKDGKLSVINILGMEQYLLGVLPYEIPNGFPLEALKAQAVISRSYAYKNLLRGRKDYDMDDTVRFQVYKGIPTKNIENIAQALKETENEIVTYKNKVIDALFHSYSGGYTASAREVYGNDVDYLVAVEDSNHFNYVPENILTWRYTLKKDVLAKELGFRADSFDVEYTESNRIAKLTLYNEDQSKSKSYTGNEFRKKFSTSNIRSTSYAVELVDGNLEIVGSGYGHGVGFSQWSSRSMAADFNMGYMDIVKYFYKGVEIIKRGE